jgi:phosphoribosylanthranilate isomerase
MTLVKVCGLTRDVDVRAAVALGACACGFVLSESPRQVSPERACWLAGEVEDALTVGVVTTEPAAWIAEALEFAGLRAVQLSAGPDGVTVAEIRAATAALEPRPIVIAAADTADAGEADLVLLDARRPGLYGGTGITLDWEALAGDPGTPHERFVLAGGLAATNVGAAIAALGPTVVDVSSGVEEAPGTKDPARLREFFAAVVHADQEVAQAARTRKRTRR